MHSVAQSEVRRWDFVYWVMELRLTTKGRNALIGCVTVALYATVVLRELINWFRL
jgi:hypothetical protein